MYAKRSSTGLVEITVTRWAYDGNSVEATATVEVQASALLCGILPSGKSLPSLIDFTHWGAAVALAVEDAARERALNAIKNAF